MTKTNNKGITLIALIVTIIVLIIIAGISIGTLTADNGILRQTNLAKVTQIEGTAREQVKLACAAMRLAIAEASAKDNSYSAVQHANAIQVELLATIKSDSTSLDKNENSWTSSEANNGDTEFTITYAGTDYKNACNDDEAKIVYTIGLSQKTIELKSEENATLKDQNGNDVVLDIGGNTQTEKGTATQYLVDTVEIGDYVEIGINYTNQNTYGFDSSYVSGIYDSNGPTGWRVLSKAESGANGTVTLVSAGTPLEFYHPYTSAGASETSLEYLADLNKTITIVTSGQGFRANGLSSPDLASVWSSKSTIIDTSKGVHALTANELTTAYTKLTGITKTMEELCYIREPFITSIMQEAAEENKLTWSDKANDLLGIGMYYWLGGDSYGDQDLWFLGSIGDVGYNYDLVIGVRVVVSLKPGVQISNDNTGDGASADSAYIVSI